MDDTRQSGCDADPRRRHPAWDILAERQLDFCEGLAALAGTWGEVEVRHELELAICVTDITRRVDALLGEFLCDVWWSLLELRDVDPSCRCPALGRVLSPDAPLVVETARASALAVASGRADDSWDRGDPTVRRQIDAIRSALHQITLGHSVMDPLGGVSRSPPLGWEPKANQAGDSETLSVGAPQLRLLP